LPGEALSLVNGEWKMENEEWSASILLAWATWKVALRFHSFAGAPWRVVSPV
jgi:hypothetical protein